MSFSHAGFRLCTIKCKDALGTHFPLVRNDSGGKGAPRYFATAHPSVPLRDFGIQKQSLCNLRKHDGTVGHIFANRNFSGKQRIYMLLWEAFFFFPLFLYSTRLSYLSHILLQFIHVVTENIIVMNVFLRYLEPHPFAVLSCYSC